MENQTWVVDRSSWPPGPWDNELEDKVEFEHQGMACMVIRNAGGNWCGYVGLEPTHKYYGKHYDDIPVEAHGGLTYTSKCKGHICHIPKPGKTDEVWWVGFDTAHCDDLSPGMLAFFQGKGYRLNSIYRTLEYTINETKALADQLVEV
jgi:hypothetical protein